MTFQEWLKTDQGRLIAFEHNKLKMLEETWNAAREDEVLNHDARIELMHTDDWNAINDRVIEIQHERNTAIAERDELLHAIMRLPKSPAAMGDGPDERVRNILDLYIKASNDYIDATRERDAARAELARAVEQWKLHDEDANRLTAELASARVEVERLRAFVTAFDAWIIKRMIKRDSIQGSLRNIMLDTRAALDTAQKEQMK